MTVGQRQSEFLDAELFQLTLAAATQRGRVYRPALSESDRHPVHETLRELLWTLSPQYETGPVSDPRHTANIEHIVRTTTQRHARVLRDGTFRIGSAQKALNLHLKYRWCRGEIPEPPHCPFDALILSRIPGWRTRSWTAIDSMNDYLDLVAAAHGVAQSQGRRSLAEWELFAYDQAVKLR